MPVRCGPLASATFGILGRRAHLGTRWLLRHRARPWGVNLERRVHYQERARLVREWRTAFTWLALAETIPHLERVAIVVIPHVKSRRSMPDTASCAPAAKAAVDGLVDARVLTDDGPTIVKRIVFEAPHVSGFDALDLVIEDLTDPAAA